MRGQSEGCPCVSTSDEAAKPKALRALVLLPDPEQPELREEERIALRVRNSATVTGRCACGAELDFSSLQAGDVSRAAITHESDCPAVSQALERLARRLGKRVRYRSYVLELVPAKESA